MSVPVVKKLKAVIEKLNCKGQKNGWIELKLISKTLENEPLFLTWSKWLR